MDVRRAAFDEGSAAAEPAHALALSRVGQTIAGRLRLERLLGVGGTASVYAARHRNGRALAVKVLHPELSHNPTIRQRFLAEGYAANKVEHPDAVAILDEGEDAEGNVFIVMDLLHGKTLSAQLAERGPLEVADVALAALGILDVLARAHDKGVVHRDIKPSNVFKTEAGVIKLLDFGVARIEDRTGEEGYGAFLTRPGTTLGTPAFMAPELAAGKLELLDAQTDLWAVGATMFQLLTGEAVHPSRTENEVIVRAATTPARSVGALRPDLPSWLVSIVDRALAFERRDRWPNARAMSAALTREARRAGLLGGALPAPAPVVESSPTAAETPAAPTRVPTRRHRAALLGALGITLALIVAGSSLVLRPRTRPAAGPITVTVEPSAVAVPSASPVSAAPASTASATPAASTAVALPALEPPRAPSHASSARAPRPQTSTARVPPEPANPLFFPSQ